MQAPARAAVPVPTINIIAWNNGVGLSRDIQLLSDGLRAAGFHTVVTPYKRNKVSKSLRSIRLRARMLARRWRLGAAHARFDANLFLEHIREGDLKYAGRQWFIPNPEWCLPRDLELLPNIDDVLAKTRHALAIFEALGCRCEYGGFTSEDRYDPTVARERAFFHLAGRSTNKGTLRLIELWRRHPEWPTLTIVQNPRTARAIEPPCPNIVHRQDYLGDDELRVLQNSHRFHLCPSDTEGYGHYIVEALSVGAVVVSTDAEPMNELVRPQFGVLVPHARPTGRQHLATTYPFDEDGMEAAVRQLVSASDATIEAMGAAAREAYVANRDSFVSRLGTAVSAMLAHPPRR